MNIFENYEIINVLYKVVVYIVLPIIVAMVLTSFISGILQGIIAMREETISYSLKIIVLGMLLYFIYPTSQEILVELARISLK